MRTNQKVVTLVCSGIIVLTIASGVKVWAEMNDKGEAEEAKVALPAEQTIASIRTAVNAKPGRVLKVEAEIETGKINCEVKVLGNDGKRYEVEVDVASNKAISIEEDEADEHNDSKDNDQDD